jgi:hypothetical protein
MRVPEAMICELKPGTSMKPGSMLPPAMYILQVTNGRLVRTVRVIIR